MRIVHTADLHLDMSFARYRVGAGFGNRRRQSLRDVFHTIVARAGDWPADALLIAGDLFEGDGVTRDTVAFLLSEFKSIPHVPVFIAPGNHDPYTADSIYATESWPENVHIFDKAEWSGFTFKEGQFTVHGFGFDAQDVSSNPFGTLAIEPDGAIHVAVAHGSERGHQPREKEAYAPFDAAAAAVDGLAYLALGHFHSVTEISGDFDTVMYYSGSPEGHSFGEPGMHHYLEVEIGPGSVAVNERPSSRLVYANYVLACDAFTSSQDLIAAARRMLAQEDQPQAAHITLTGPCAPEISEQFPTVYDVLAPELEHLVLTDRTDPLEDYEALVRDGTSLSVFVRTLNEEIADASHDEARREMLDRTRELGVAAFRQREVEIRGLEGA